MNHKCSPANHKNSSNSFVSDSKPKDNNSIENSGVSDKPNASAPTTETSLGYNSSLQDATGAQIPVVLQNGTATAINDVSHEVEEEENASNGKGVKTLMTGFNKLNISSVEEEPSSCSLSTKNAGGSPTDANASKIPKDIEDGDNCSSVVQVTQKVSSLQLDDDQKTSENHQVGYNSGNSNLRKDDAAANSSNSLHCSNDHQNRTKTLSAEEASSENANSGNFPMNVEDIGNKNSKDATQQKNGEVKSHNEEAVNVFKESFEVKNEGQAQCGDNNASNILKTRRENLKAARQSAMNTLAPR